MKKFIKILETIAALIFGILGVICLIPLMAIYLLISIPAAAILDIWEDK